MPTSHVHRVDFLVKNMRWNHTPTAGPHEPVGAANHVVDLNNMIPRLASTTWVIRTHSSRREKGSHVHRFTLWCWWIGLDLISRVGAIERPGSAARHACSHE